MNSRLVLIALLAALAGACGGKEPPAGVAREAAAPAVNPSSATEDPTADMVIEVRAEDAAAQADADAIRGALATALAAATPAAVADEAPAGESTDWKYSAGSHFSKLATSQGTSSPPGTIEVAEIFWYGCPHCFDFDPLVERWSNELPGNVSFVRIPVMWNPANEVHARAFYTAESLGKLDELHGAIFEAFHRQGKTLAREDEIRELFTAHGVSAADFDRTFQSFGVESKLKRAKNLTQRYRIRSVPVMVVNGKYVTDGPEIRSYDDMLSVAGELVEREAQAL